MKDQDISKIVQYYQASQWAYRMFCYDESSLGMHFGFWDKETKNRQEAMKNENNYVIRKGNINASMKVLDAGCGVGGTTIDIAQKTGAHVVGITIDPKQVELAKHYAKKKGVGAQTTFLVMDYTATKFPSSSFDVVYAIESVCCAFPKAAFLRETFRILKPGGMLIILDAYTTRLPKTQHEKDMLSAFNEAFALNELSREKDIRMVMHSIGFSSIESINYSQKVIPSMEYFMKLSTWMWPFSVVLSWIPLSKFQALKRNAIALHSGGEMYKLGLVEYVMHVGIKPRNSNKN